MILCFAIALLSDVVDEYDRADLETGDEKEDEYLVYLFLSFGFFIKNYDVY